VAREAWPPLSVDIPTGAIGQARDHIFFGVTRERDPDMSTTTPPGKFDKQKSIFFSGWPVSMASAISRSQSNQGNLTSKRQHFTLAHETGHIISVRELNRRIDELPTDEGEAAAH